MASIFDRVKTQLGYAPPQENPSLLQQAIGGDGTENSGLSLQQRLAGFGVAFIATIVCWSLGSLSLMALRISSFIFMFTAGNACALIATCFLVGPKQQLANMTQKDRLYAAIAFLLAMVLTLVASIHFRTYFSVFFIVMPCMFVQIAALLWYCLTYIPGGQDFLWRIIGRAQTAGESMV